MHLRPRASSAAALQRHPLPIADVPTLRNPSFTTFPFTELNFDTYVAKFTAVPMLARGRGLGAGCSEGMLRRLMVPRALSSLGWMPNPFSTPERDAWRQTLRQFVETELKPHADAW